MRLYVGNLPFTCTEDELREAFSAHGNVVDCKIIIDRETGRSRGFGFVEMEDGEGAVEAMNGANFGGRALVVNEARERQGGGGGGGGGGFGGGRGGGGGGRGGFGGGGGGGGRGGFGGGGGGGGRGGFGGGRGGGGGGGGGRGGYEDRGGGW